MSLIEIEADNAAVRGLGDISGLYVVRSAAKDVGSGRSRVTAYAAEDLYPELERRGCTIEIVMSSDDIEQFHRRVALVIAPPDRAGPVG